MIDVLYIKGAQSRNYDQELRYSLRSLEACVKDVGRVFITGECPNFIKKTAVIYTPEHDIGCPPVNHWWKVSQTIKKTDISDDFVLMYDDIFFTKDTKLENYPFYYRGMLTDSQAGSTIYRKSISNAKKWLTEHNYPYLDYELHVPCVYNKRNFLKLDPIFEPIKRENPAMVVRSIYANMFVKDQPYRKDIKIRMSNECVDFILNGADCFSVSDWVFECNTYAWLSAHYTKKSRWEK